MDIFWTLLWTSAWTLDMDLTRFLDLFWTKIDAVPNWGVFWTCGPLRGPSRGLVDFGFWTFAWTLRARQLNVQSFSARADYAGNRLSHIFRPRADR